MLFGNAELNLKKFKKILDIFEKTKKVLLYFLFDPQNVSSFLQELKLFQMMATLP